LKYSPKNLNEHINKNNSYQFISSTIDKDEISESRKIVAGPWVFKNFYEYENSTNSQEFYSIPNNFSSFHDCKNDHDYIKKLIEIYSLHLKDFLNKFHKTNHSQRYWDILILPWLTTYIPCQLIRWRIIEKSLTGNKKLLFSEITIDEDLNPCTTEDYLELVRDNHKFNYLIFKNMFLFFKYKRKKNIVFIKSTLRPKKYSKKNFYFKKGKIFYYKLIEKINNIIAQKNLIYIDNNSFKKKIFIKLNLKLNQLPIFLFNKTFQYLLSSGVKFNHKLRKDINFVFKEDFKKKDFFVEFLDEIIKFDVPKSFLEGYKIFNNSINHLSFNPKIIISSYHYNNERLKFWIAKKVNIDKSTFFQLQHGANNQQRFSACHEIDAKTADQRLVWSQPRERNDIQMPSSKFMNLKKLNNKGLCLTYVEKPIFTFPKRINTDENYFINIKNIILLKKNLDQSHFKNLIYAPSGSNYDVERKEVVKILGKNKIQKKQTLFKCIKFSKILICSYAETAFLECLLSGRPTILINTYPRIPFNDVNEETHKELIKNNISFDNAKEAALHVNKIGNNPNLWWDSNGVQDAIENFKNKFCKIDENSTDVWKNFLIRELEKKF